MPFSPDSGYQDKTTPLISLGGVKAAPGYGATTECTSISVAAGDMNAWNANPLRLWMIIQNLSADGVKCALGSFGVLTTNLGVTLNQYDVFIIDKNMPWSGAVSFLSEGGAITVGIQECSLTRAGK